MITYEELLTELMSQADGEYRSFHSKLLKNPAINVIGVRMPALRAIAKSYKTEWERILTFPDEYYEVTFLKFTVVGLLPYQTFCKTVDGILPLLDNWATCDCFTANCIKKNREDFFGKIEGYLHSEREFTRRFGLVCLLRYYVKDGKYLHFICRAAEESDGAYYVMTAAAWLIAEACVYHYDEMYGFLSRNTLSAETHNKAIQKACESYRITLEQKAALRSIRRKNCGKG